LGEITLQVVHSVASERRDHQHRVEIAALCKLGGEPEQTLPANAIDLVERQHGAPTTLAEPIEDAGNIGRDPVGGVDQQHGLIGILGPRPSSRHHRPVEPPTRGKNARRVDIDELRGALDRDAQQPRASGLRLWRNDREFVSDQPVQQR
jgi:hypothetical protein